MSLQAGVRFGPYEVTGLLGAGGMGEVYRARDTRLKREVALKILPESFAADPDRLARFQREAEVLASLNHPHIAAIYGLEETNGQQALVLELVEGETLADRIRRGPLPIDEALPIARQIAEALEAAHEQGVIHRDLKPANIKITPDGVVKVLDFGLAKALGPPEGGPYVPGVGAGFSRPDATASPTITSPAMMTGVGTILGTAAYMAPEQAKGRPADKRSDIWAFGCVLYEMLTGKRAFEGEDVSDTLAAVLRGEPNWSALPADASLPIRTLLKGCLERDRRQRIGDISTALFVLRQAGTLMPAGEASRVPGGARPPFWRREAMSIVTLIVGAAIAATLVWLAMRPAPPRVTRLTMTGSSAATALTINGTYRDLAITPDGTRVVYVGANGSQLLVRELEQLEPTILVNSGTPNSPFVSPDGQWVGFFDGTETLKKVAINGGAPITLHSGGLGGPRGATWAADDTIVLAANTLPAGLLRISASGSKPIVLTTPATNERDHHWPEFLPGRQAVLFTIVPMGSIENALIAVLDLRTGTQKIVVRGGSHAHFVSSGHLVYSTGGALSAVAFDLERLEVVGAPVLVVPEVMTAASGAANFDVAANGTLAYAAGGNPGTSRTLVWVDRQGRTTSIDAPPRGYSFIQLSPDGQRIALDVRDHDRDIYLWNVGTEALTRFTFGAGQEQLPTWTPDGRRLIFNAGGLLYGQAVDGSGRPERLGEGQLASSVSPDGKRLVFAEGGDVKELALDGSGRIRPLLQTPAGERNAVISPNGRWLAYESNESGREEVHVRPFPDVEGGRWQVSTAGGARPVWARNGTELFYLAPGGALMRVTVDSGTTWSAGVSIKLFDWPYYSTAAANGRTYDVSADGQRFLMIRRGDGSDDSASPPIVIVQYWTEELKRLVPVN